MADWDIDVPDQKPKKISKDLIPYEMSHMLISFPPELYGRIKDAIESIIDIPGLEIEQSSN